MLDRQQNAGNPDDEMDHLAVEYILPIARLDNET